MKRIIVVFCLMIATIEMWGQSIGGALSNGSQSTSMSQHSITASDMSSLCSKKKSIEVQTMLENRGWMYMKTSRNDRLTTTTMALEPNYYSENRAMAWMYIQCDADGVQRIVFSFSTDKFIRTFEQTISKAGFRPFDFSEYGDDINFGYQTKNKLLFIKHDYDGYTIECLRKNGAFDNLNGKKREARKDGGYVEYTLKNGKVIGIVKLYNDDDILEKEYFWENGNINGEYKEYHSDGKHVSVSGTYKNGQMNGIFKFYTLSGNIWKESKYENDILREDKVYEGDGLLIDKKGYDDVQNLTEWIQVDYCSDNPEKVETKEITLIAGDSSNYRKYKLVDGNLQLVQYLTMNGQAMMIGKDTICLNKRYLWVTTDDGTILPQSVFAADATIDEKTDVYFSVLPKCNISFMDMKDGHINGWFRCYVDTSIHKKIYVGKKTSGDYFPTKTDTNKLSMYWKCNIKNNKIDGVSELYNPITGELCQKAYYSNGKLEGKCQTILSDRTEECHYTDGVRNGEYSYSDDYGLIIKGHYKQGDRDGKWIWQKKDSKECVEMMVFEGKRNGLCKYTNSLGNIVFETKYHSNAQNGQTLLNDIYGNNIFKLYFNNGIVKTIVDYRNKQAIISMNNLQSDTITVTVSTATDKTSIQYLHPNFVFHFQGNSTIELAQLLDSLWSSGVLKPVGLFSKTDRYNNVLVEGRFDSKQHQTGLWSYYFPQQEVKMVYDYQHGETKYYDKFGLSYSGVFEYTDTVSDIKEIRKVKGGICDQNKIKRYRLSTDKRYKDEYIPNYFPVKMGSHNYVFPNTIDFDKLYSSYHGDYASLSDNWPPFVDETYPSFHIDTIEQDAIWLGRFYSCRPLGLFKYYEEAGFPGGEEALRQYLEDNLQYPQLAIDANISGSVLVIFTVEKDGSISNVHSKNNIGGGCNEEAERLIRSMPLWNPVKIDGKPVRTEYKLPILFQLKNQN